MKIKIILLLLAVSITSFGQSFKKGQVDINLGYGFGNTFIDSKYDVSIPAISGVLDFGISNSLSLGVYVGESKAKWTVTGTDVCNNGNGNGNYSYTYVYTHEAKHLIVALRSSYHLNSLFQNENLDAYVGLQLGNNFETDEYAITTTPFCDKMNKSSFDNKFYDGFIWSAYAGARYRFTDHIGIFGELGYGIVFFNAGLNIKF